VVVAFSILMEVQLEEGLGIQWLSSDGIVAIFLQVRYNVPVKDDPHTHQTIS